MKVRLCVHPLQDADESPRTHQDQCYVVSVGGRWLFANDGRLTILKGIKAVRSFIRLINMSCYESGEPAQIKSDCGKGAYRIAVGPHQPPDGSGRTR